MSLVDKIGALVQTGVTIGGLVFGGGILYADVQDIKHDVAKSEGLVTQTQVLETKLENAEKTQSETIRVLGKLSDSVDSLSKNVARLEGKLEK